MEKSKISYSMLIEPKLHAKLTREAKRLGIPKNKVIEFALKEVFKNKNFSLGVQ